MPAGRPRQGCQAPRPSTRRCAPLAAVPLRPRPARPGRAPRCRRSSESQVPPGSAWPGRGVSAQLSDSWPNHVNYLFGFFQSISCCVPQGGSGVKGAGRKGLPEAGARTRKKAKLRAQAEEASLSAAGQSLTGLAEEGLGTRGSGRVWKSKPTRWSACPGAGPRGCGRLVSRQASSPGGCRPPPVSCGPVALVPDTESASATRCCRSQPVSHLRRTVQRRRVCRLN